MHHAGGCPEGVLGAPARTCYVTGGEVLEGNPHPLALARGQQVDAVDPSEQPGEEELPIKERRVEAVHEEHDPAAGTQDTQSLDVQEADTVPDGRDPPGRRPSGTPARLDAVPVPDQGEHADKNKDGEERCHLDSLQKICVDNRKQVE